MENQTIDCTLKDLREMVSRISVHENSDTPIKIIAEQNCIRVFKPVLPGKTDDLQLLAWLPRNSPG